MSDGSPAPFFVGPVDDPDRYRLSVAVASGAEGILYRATLTHGGGAFDVAVKMLQPAHHDRMDLWRQRWDAQVALLRRLHMPGLVVVREGFVGPLPHLADTPGEPSALGLYVVMDWVDGEPLDRWAERRPEATAAELLGALVPVGAALDMLHAGTVTGGLPVVHLDVKPSNVLMTNTGAVLVDVGNLRGLDAASRPTGIVGTPGYISPEGRTDGTWGPASDRYALGAVAWSLLVGREPPQDADPERLRDELAGAPRVAGRPEVVDHVMAMLDPDPAQRPAPLANWVAQLRQSSLVEAATPRPRATRRAPARSPAEEDPGPRGGPFRCDVALVDAETGDRRQVAISGDAADRVDALVEQLAPLAGGHRDFWVDGTPLASGATLAASGIVAGSTVSYGAPVTSPRRAPGSWQLRVVGGIDAGATWTLTPGRRVIGRGATADIRLADPDVSREHAYLDLTPDGRLHLVDARSTNGTIVEGRAVTEHDLRPGEAFLCGATLFEVAAVNLETLDTVPVAPTALGVHRRFRLARPTWPTDVRLPDRDVDEEMPSLNLALTLAPGALMLVIALALQEPRMLLFVAMSPVLGVARAVSQRRTWRARHAKDLAQRHADLAGAQARLAAAHAAERAGRRTQSPDLAELAVHTRAPGRRLWERRPDDDDFLELRVGTATLASTVAVRTGANDAEPATVWAAPVTVPLRTFANLSIVGPSPPARRVAGAAVLGLAASHAPGDVKIVVCADDDGDAWSWVAWLPHCRWSADDDSVLVGSSAATTHARLAELRELVKRRREATGSGRAPTLPAVVVIAEGTTRLLREGFGEILRDGPAVGVHAICIDASQVPEHCGASVTIRHDGPDGAHVDATGRARVNDVLLDLPSAATCDLVARAMAPLRALSDDGARELPGALRLLDVLGLDTLDADAVIRSWAARSPAADAVVGITSDGPFGVDLTRHGPHGLVAGTTRSGKSEFLKTLVASLALANHPDDLQFLFVDFKGGLDYDIAKELPHTVALATSEDLEDFGRTVRLLESEIGRRRTMFAGARTTTIEGYLTARRSNPRLAPLGRLLVVADEFAELVERAPDQLSQLVSVARTGAAFGVHLLLATQKPAGAVTGQIAANVAMRVCFRVATPEESFAVMDAPDAAAIAERNRGRGYLRAHQEPLVEFQAARVAGARPGRVASTELRATLRLWHELGRPVAESRSAEVPAPDTDFWDVLQATRAAAVDAGWQRNAVPWPRPLPDVVALDELPAPAGDGELVGFAVMDDPATQAHQLAGLRPLDGHLAIAGSSGSGRTTALLSVAAAAARTSSAAATHLYALDFAGGGLRPLTELPHFGGGAFDDPEHALRLVRELDRIIDERLELFSAHGLAGFADHQRSGADPLPQLLLLVDGWDVIAEEGVRSGLTDAVLALLARGSAAGFATVVAGDRSVAMGRAGRLISARWALRLHDPNDYGTVGIGYRDVPKSPLPPGRALVAPDAAQVQIALIADPAGEGQAAALRAVARAVTTRDRAVADCWPVRFEPLPRRLPLATLVERESPPAAARLPVPLGISAETRRPVWFDLDGGARTFFIGGPPRSGRTSALRAAATVLADRGARVALLCPGRSTLGELAAHPARPIVICAEDARRPDLDALAGADVVLVDDAELLDPAHPSTLELLGGAAAAVCVALAADTLSGSTGIAPVLKRGRTGVLLSPRNRFDGSVFGVTFDDQHVFNGPPGRGVAAIGGALDVVQLPEA